MKSICLLITALFFQLSMCFAQLKSLDPVPLDDAWKQKIYELAPESSTAPVSKKHKVLLFSLFTGFDHWVSFRGQGNYLSGVFILNNVKGKFYYIKPL